MKSNKTIVSFYNDMKKICNNEFLSNSDILSEVGDLMNEYDLSTSDLQDIVNAYPNDSDVEMCVASQLEYELEEKKINNNLNAILTKNGVQNINSFIKELEKNGFKIERIY
jgi:hypothetical protein